MISGSIIGAYISGTLCGFLLPWFLIKCSKLSLLPTSTTIISVGASAMISGLLASILCSTIELISLILSNKFYEIMSLLALYLFGSVSSGFHLFGGILGWGISWGSEEGYYHLILLPLIALSMKSGNFSLFGTLDMLCLCLPCAGVCSAVYILSVLAAKKEMNERLNHTRTTVNSDTRKKNDDSREKSGTPIDGTSHDDSVSALSGINCVRVSSMQTRSSASKRRESAIEKPDTDTISLTASQNVEKMSIGTEVDKKYSCRRGNSPNAEFLGIDNKKVAVSSTSLGVDQGTREDSKEKGIASTDDSSVKQTETDNRNYQHHINLGRRGTISNLLMGDFVEACYPYSQGNRWVLLSVRVASSVAGSLLIGYLGMDVKAIDCVRTDSNNDFSILLSDSVKATVGSCVNGPFRSSAYLPLPLSILLVYLGSIVPKSNWTSTYPSELTVLLCSALIAYILPFFVTLIVYRNMEKIDLKP